MTAGTYTPIVTPCWAPVQVDQNGNDYFDLFGEYVFPKSAGTMSIDDREADLNPAGADCDTDVIYFEDDSEPPNIVRVRQVTRAGFGILNIYTDEEIIGGNWKAVIAGGDPTWRSANGFPCAGGIIPVTGG